MMKRFILFLLSTSILFSGCGTIRTHRNLEQPTIGTLTTSVGGTIFRLNKIGDLPNAYGGRDIWGGKTDKGFSELKLIAIKDQILTLEVTDVNKSSSETTMDRYKPFNRNAVISAQVENNIQLGASDTAPKSQRFDFDLNKQKELVVSGVKVYFLNVQPYSIEYKLEDIENGLGHK